MHLDQNVGFAEQWVGMATNRAAFCPEQISQLTVLREYQCTRGQMTFFMPLSVSGELPPRVPNHRGRVFSHTPVCLFLTRDRPARWCQPRCREGLYLVAERAVS